MKKIAFSMIAIFTFTFITLSPANASCNLSTDSWGRTTGTCDGQRVSTSTDSWGRTTGSIGNKRVSCSKDAWGRTSCR